MRQVKIEHPNKKGRKKDEQQCPSEPKGQKKDLRFFGRAGRILEMGR